MAQFQMRVIAQLNDLWEANLEHIEALQTLGVDKCDCCGRWEKHVWLLPDHCWCARCLEGNPDGPIGEEVEEEEAVKMAESIARYLAGRGQTRFPSGMVREAYRKMSKRE